MPDGMESLSKMRSASSTGQRSSAKMMASTTARAGCTPSASWTVWRSPSSTPIEITAIGTW